MKRFAMLLIGSLLFSCSSQHFSKGDYSFYDKNFTLPSASMLRTDGIYILTSISTDESDGTVQPIKEPKFYKFYKTGQSNLVLYNANEIQSNDSYNQLLEQASKPKKATLFESYYKIQENKIIIQGIVFPVKEFEYKYGFLGKNEFTIVKATKEGNGKFDDKNFTKYYQERYSFLPLNGLNPENPDW